MEKNIKQEFQPVLCDMCLDKQTPALKTCLKCEISMCAQHLQAHLTTPVLLQTHPLTKPTAPGGLSSGAIRCPEHGKLLEYYCLDDRTCVCVSCSIEGQHRLHNMKTLPSAHKVLVEKLREELKELAEREKRGEALKSWETGQTKALETSGKDLVKGVLALRDTGLTKVQSSVTARLGDIQTAQQNIEAALSEDDAHLFLQRYAEVHEAVERTRTVDFTHGLEKEAEPAEVVSDLLKYGCEAMKKVKKLQRDLLVLVDPHKQHWGETKLTNVTFDPKTLGKDFLLSSDMKMLSCRSPIQQQQQQQQQQKQRVYFQNDTNQDLCWAIQFSDKYDWCVGICPKDVSPHNEPSILYGLQWKNKQIQGLNTERVKVAYSMCSGTHDYSMERSTPNYYRTANIIEYPPKSSSTPQIMDFLNKLQVQWECSSQTLSFFTRGECDEMIFLYCVKVDYYNQLHPFVTLEKRQDQPASYSYPTSAYHASYPYHANIQCHNTESPQYVDFVCSLNDENLSAIYSHSQTRGDVGAGCRASEVFEEC